MEQQSFMYSFVARGNLVLAEYSAFSGNFSTVAVQCMQNLPQGNNKFTCTVDQHTFNYLVENGFTYMVVADENIGRSIPFTYLKRVNEDFLQHFGDGEADIATAHSLDTDFGFKLREHMQYCADHSQEIDGMKKLNAQVSEVKEIMMGNIDKVLGRQEDLELKVDKTGDLGHQTERFQKKRSLLRRKMCLQNMKIRLVMLAIVTLMVLIVLLAACNGFKC